MITNTEFIYFLKDLLEPIAPVKTSRFFGGTGISCHGVQFAMIMTNSLYFVVDDTSRLKYLQARMLPFSYITKNGLVQVHKYYEVPADVLEDSDQFELWAKEALSIAQKTRKPSKPLKIVLSTNK